MNNYEKIKNMSLDEMVKFIRLATSCNDICVFCGKCFSDDGLDCHQGIKEWLKQED